MTYFTESSSMVNISYKLPILIMLTISAYFQICHFSVVLIIIAYRIESNNIETDEYFSIARENIITF